MTRPTGIPNKATSRFKAALSQLLENSSDDMIGWLAEIENPKDRFDVLSKFVEFIHPKLARNTITGDDDKPLFPDEVKITHVDSGHTDSK